MAEGTRETMEVKQLSRDGHLPMKSNVNVNTNLYSALGGTPSSYQLHFTIAAAKANHHSVSHQYEREPPSPQINSLGSIQVRITFCAVYLVTIALIAATHIHTFTHGR